MRFPLALTAKIARHIIKHKLRRTPKFALVLQLEPLHTCNLTCTGCGRIREYSTNLKDMMSLEDCLASANECDAPMVSICGGEPLIHPKIEELVNGILAQGRIVYVCTNGMFMRKKMRDYLASIYSPALESQIANLKSQNLITARDAEQIRNGDEKARSKVVIRPTKWMYWNVHIDGLEYTHDLIVEREGVFKECVEAIKMAKLLGYQVATNTTVYKETDVKEIEGMFEFFSSLEVDGHTISPGYEYDAAKKDMVKRLHRQPEDFFLTRKMTRQKFAKIQEWGERFTIFGTPVYQEFLAGKRELTCTAWAIPTRNIKGWKAPCYLMTDGHYAGYHEMLEKVDWDKYGVVDGVARDPRCENCMVHCGYDPSGALGTNFQRGDNWKNFKYNFWPKPKPYYPGRDVRAFNGVSIGKGHLAEAKAAINSPRAAMNGAQAVFQRREEPHEHNGNGSCGNGDASQREELLEKIADAKKGE
ncbi:MAG: adenosyl-hopene transferase HpnH [Verrucomicrobia bacterium]|nr:adenosyl-hopene transferase HpnH [Verrucomicrobiota bacterium]